MATVFVVSDTHFSHANILTFRGQDGQLLRPFGSAEEMDEHMIERWNSVVRPQDHVYHLGDVAMAKSAVGLLTRCNGHKRLVRGNHDIYSTKYYMQFFDEIYGVRVLEGLAMTHIPIHPDSVKAGWINVHGHLHNNKVRESLGAQYFNACVEMIDYTPITIEQIKAQF